MPSRADAWSLVCEFVQSESLRRHMLAVEAACRAYARKYGEEEEKWGVVGLLHDFDYERWPNPPDHPLRGAEILRERGYPDDVIYAIKSHADYLQHEAPRTHLVDKVLYACDELAGFITAVALMRPERIVGLQASSVKKKLKQKSFAAAVSREDIDRGAADLGVPLDQHIQFVIDAMAAQADALGLNRTTQTGGELKDGIFEPRSNIVIAEKSDTRRSVDVESFFKRIADECLPHIDCFTVPFYGVQDEQIKHDRSGVLYRIADHHFILTASHDLRGIVQNNIPLYIPNADPNALPFPLVDCVFHTTEEVGRDVAAIKLSPEVVEALQPAKKFLTHNRISQRDDNQGLYVVFGFPMVWSGVVAPQKIASYPLVYTARPYMGDRYPGTFFDPNVHIVLDFDQEAVECLGGAPAQIPSIKGVSGCGIWRVTDWDARRIENWSPKQLRLVALQHRRIKDGDASYIQGTWIRFALDLVLDKYPHLKNAMSLFYPSDNEV